MGGKIYFIVFLGFSIGKCSHNIGCFIQYIARVIFVNTLGPEGFKYCFIVFAILNLTSAIFSWRINFEYNENEAKLIATKSKSAE
jgi:hypothetical protein